MGYFFVEAHGDLPYTFYFTVLTIPDRRFLMESIHVFPKQPNTNPASVDIRLYATGCVNDLLSSSLRAVDFGFRYVGKMGFA